MPAGSRSERAASPLILPARSIKARDFLVFDLSPFRQIQLLSLFDGRQYADDRFLARLHGAADTLLLGANRFNQIASAEDEASSR